MGRDRRYDSSIIKDGFSQWLVGKLGPIPLHDEVTFLMFPSCRIIFVPYGTAQDIVSTAYAQDQSPELRVFALFDAQENGFGSLNGEGLRPHVPGSDIDFDLMGVSGRAVHAVDARSSFTAEVKFINKDRLCAGYGECLQPLIARRILLVARAIVTYLPDLLLDFGWERPQNL
jgi:hypothetical protein